MIRKVCQGIIPFLNKKVQSSFCKPCSYHFSKNRILAFFIPNRRFITSVFDLALKIFNPSFNLNSKTLLFSLPEIHA